MSEPPIIPDADPGPEVSGWNDSPVAGDRVDLHMGPIIAGDPEGARVEVTETGLRAYDSAGVETASIAGEGGEFVGGEFRTSDQMPGQVILSNTANQGAPGISIEPEDDTGYDVLPSIGPGADDMHISGGVSTAGDMAGAQFRAGGTTLYWNGPGATGGGSWASVADGEAGLTCRPDRTNADHESAIRARADDAVVYSEGPNGTGFLSASPYGGLLEHVSPGDPTARSESRAEAAPEYLRLERKAPGVTDSHRLILDDDGVWVQTVNSPSPVSYNLLETAQDSGWQSVTVGSGITPSASFAWRNKGGIIWWRGTVTATWAEGWNDIATDLPATIRPEYGYTVNEAGTATGVLIRVQVNGVLQLYSPTAGTSTHRFTSLSYPVG